MIAWHTAKHMVAIAGRVSDAETRKPMGGVDVSIIEMPQESKRRVQGRALQYGKRWDSALDRLDKTRTRPDGLFYFVDLPPGDYTIRASLVRLRRLYGIGQQDVSLSRAADGTVARAFLNIELRPTTVKGRITGPGREGGVAMAEIRVKGGGERTFSGAQGEYVLNCVEPGTRTIVVLAQGYKPVSKAVTLEAPGAVGTLNFVLDKESGSTNLAQNAAGKTRASGARSNPN